MTDVTAVSASGAVHSAQPRTDDALWAAATALEAQFLAEMLAAAGLGATSEEFGGGAGEDQFASFLRLEQAKGMARQGGIGLAESIFDAMKRSTGDE